MGTPQVQKRIAHKRIVQSKARNQCLVVGHLKMQHYQVHLRNNHQHLVWVQMQKHLRSVVEHSQHSEGLHQINNNNNFSKTTHRCLSQL